jgi:hypothetical protein
MEVMKRIVMAVITCAAFGVIGLAPQFAQAATTEGTGFWPVNTGRTYTTTNTPKKTVYFAVSPLNKVTTVATTADTYFYSTIICSDTFVPRNAPRIHDIPGSSISSVITCPSGTTVVYGGAYVWWP